MLPTFASLTFSFLLDTVGYDYQTEAPKCPRHQRDLQDILFLGVVTPTDIYQLRN